MLSLRFLVNYTNLAGRLSDWELTHCASISLGDNRATDMVVRNESDKCCKNYECSNIRSQS